MTGLTQIKLRSTGGAKPTMEPSKKGCDFIKGYEQFSPKAYMPTPKDVPTVGFGFTKGVKMGDTITYQEATKRFEEEIKEFSKGVTDLVKIDLKQNEFDALVSLVYNIGLGAFKGSTCLRLLNAGDKAAAIVNACHPTHGWVKQKGKILNGLVDRRNKEQDMFLQGVYTIKKVKY